MEKVLIIFQQLWRLLLPRPEIVSFHLFRLQYVFFHHQSYLSYFEDLPSVILAPSPEADALFHQLHSVAREFDRPQLAGLPHPGLDYVPVLWQNTSVEEGEFPPPEGYVLVRIPNAAKDQSRGLGSILSFLHSRVNRVLRPISLPIPPSWFSTAANFVARAQVEFANRRIEARAARASRENQERPVARPRRPPPSPPLSGSDAEVTL